MTEKLICVYKKSRVDGCLDVLIMMSDNIDDK